jgi:hypothetical protein
MALTIQMVTAALKEIAHVIIVETIERVLAFPAELHKVQMTQQAQLMGDRRLRHAEQLGQIIDAQLGVQQRRNHAQARRVSQRLEEFGKPQRIGLSEQVRSGMNNQVGMNRCFVAAVAHNSHEIPQMNECSYIHESNIVILCCQPIAIGNCRGKAF